MADLAMAFHWPLPTMLDMTVVELAQWRERARVRYESSD